MVVVLREQNETLQAGRYAEAEQSLEDRSPMLRPRLQTIQAKLDTAKTNAWSNRPPRHSQILTLR